MVNLHFPSNLTEEETMLQAKYEKLRKKKKALENHKSPKVEIERPVAKRPKMEAKNAREIAKKLLKSGAIAAIPKTQRREEQGSGFKRPCGLERKLERNLSAYQPFASSSVDTDDKNPLKKLYNTQSDEARDDFVPPVVLKQQSPSLPKCGHILFVSVVNSNNQSLTEECLRTTFTPFGEIVNINLEVEKNRGFVTFDTMESAKAALSAMNGKMTANNFQLKISYARKQPTFRPRISETSSGPLWSTQGTNQGSIKESPKDHRSLVSYADNPFSD